jgi:TRAP-type C4-dicarboxylate transport system substrate-binding protein
MKPSTGILFRSTLAAAAVWSFTTVGAVAQELPEAAISVIGSTDQSVMHKTIERPFWTETIPTTSNGAITVDFRGLLTSGLKGPEIVRLLRSGALSVAHGVFASVAADDETFSGVDIPGLAPDLETARAVADAYRPVIDRVFREKHGIKLLAMLPFSSQVFFCNAPVTSLADLQGMKVRVFGRSLADLVEAKGAAAVTIPFGEVVPALQTGLADCAITGIASGNSSKWTDVTTTLFNLPVGWSISFYAANLDTWERLDPAVREFLEASIADLENDVWDFTARENQDALNCNIGADPCEYGTKASMTLAELSDADRAELKRVMEEVVIPRWAERCGSACAEEWNATVGAVVGITAPVQ